ncbi:hypothetical protein JXB27_03335, partial [Candidatus Woesearchaeota archaeon]|nr:hypothetical protein [Candidatus Woesearchaeota archaeon]
MIKQKYSTIMALFMVAASLMILTSCNIIVRKDQLATDMTGTGGLTLTLPKIPASLYPGQGLEIPIILENTGTHNIENAILAISGYDE